MCATDAALLERWQRHRDADAFTELVRRHSGMVVASCKRVLGDPSLAEDVAQECFIALMQSRESVRVSLGAWLHTIAVRRSIDRVKGDARRRKRETAYAEGQPAEQVLDTSVDEILDHVDEAIAGLPDIYRTVIVGRFLANRTHIELARELGVAESTVRHRVDKGVERVRETLGRRGLAVSGAGLAAMLASTVEAAPAEFVARLGKLALSGSVTAPVAGAVSVAAVLKIAAVLVTMAGLGGVLWFGAAHRVTTSPPTARETVDTPQSRADAVPDQDDREAAHAPGSPIAPTNASPAAAPAETVEPFSIRGRVFDARTGSGIAGARAYVYPEGGGTHLGRSKPTDADGFYVLPPIKDGMYRVSLETIKDYPDPRGSRSVAVQIKHGEPVDGIDFALERGLPVSGMVIDAKGQPVADADVAATISTTPNPIRTTSGKQGQFTLYMPQISDALRLQAQNTQAESGVEGTFKLPENGLEGVVLMLDRPKTASVAGTVVDGSGKPMAGAQLYLVRKDGSHLGFGASGESGKDGSYSVSGLASAAYGIVVTPKGVSGYSTAEEYARIHPAPGEALSGVDIVYGEKGGMAISGRVVDRTGRAVERARVTCFTDRTMENAYTDKNGAFTITGLGNRPYTVAAEHDQYSRTSVQVPAGTVDAEIIMKQRGSLAGRVVRADTGAALTAFTLGYVIGEIRTFDEMLFSSGKAMESADGTFSIGQTQAGNVTVAAWAPGFAPEWRIVEVHEDEAVRVEFRLQPVAPFEGSVVNEAGEPVANATVYFVSGVTLDRMDRAAATRSDGQGRFMVDSLPLDAQRLCAYCPGYGAGTIKLPGEHQIVLPRSATVTGTVRFDGVAMSDIFINAPYLEAEYLPGIHQQPEPDGSFRFAGMSPGLLTINVVAGTLEGRPQITRIVDLKAGQEARVDIVFERGNAVVEGLVTVDGSPVNAAYLSLKRLVGDTTQSLSATPGLDGRYRFDAVWAGNLTLSIARVDPKHPYDPIIQEVSLSVADGQVLRQDIELPPLP